jgi:vitamin B12 transporter
MSSSTGIALGALAALCICIAPVRAQTPSTPKLETVVITAARGAQPLSELLADVSTIGPEEIERAGQASLVEILQRVPGVEIASTGGPGTVSSVFLRGANANHTLVLVDGLRVDASSNGAAAFEAIPLAQVDHIEILRGPASSLYGPDAIGGVIQIFTKGAEDRQGAPRPSANVGMGSYRTVTGDAGVSGGNRMLRYAFNAGYADSEGFNALRNPQAFGFNPDRDGYRSDSASGLLALRYREHDELALQFFANRLNAQFDASPNFDDRLITTLESYAVSARNQLATNWQSLLRAGRSVDDSHSESATFAGTIRSTQTLYTWQNDFTLAADRLQLAAERREERVAGDTAYAVTGRDTNSAVGVYQLRRDAYALQGNLRYDDSSQFGGKTTGALALGYRFAPQWRVTASAGTAFHAPTFNDLYFPGFSNPNLRPETARNVEAGLHFARASAGADLVAYRNRVHDLIVFQCDANFNCAPVNVNNARLTGATLSAHQAWGDTQAQASLDIQQPEDEASGHLLPRRARRHAAASLTHTLGQWVVGAEWAASSARFDDPANTRPMGGYGLLNLTASYALAPAWQVVMRANNVLDKQYEIARDYATPGANVFVALQYRP